MDIDEIIAEATIKPEAPKAEPTKPEPEKPEEAEPGVQEEPKEEPTLTAEQRELEELRRATKKDNRKIGKLTALKYQLERELETARTTKAAPEKPSDDEPKESDFEGKPYGDYLKAVARYHAKNEFKESQKQTNDDRAKSAAQEWEEERKEVVDENYKLAKTTFPDFDDVLEDITGADGQIPLSPALRKALLTADNGAFALYALAKEGLLEKANAMSPERAAMTIARMEDKGLALSKAKTVTKAPTPMTPAKGSATGGKRPENLSGDEIRSWLKAK